jgi:hypothetical protein
MQRDREIHIDPDEDPWIARGYRHERRLSRLILLCADYRKVSSFEE